MSHDLEGIGVLVTRPAEQSDRLCQLIESLGGTAIRFPTIEIQPVDKLEIDEVVGNPDDYHWMIFVSANAVRYGLGILGLKSKTPCRLAAIGSATARALAEAGLGPVLTPSKGFRSEDLLERPELHRVAGQRILIVRGIGGRELLAETLRQRGAETRYAEVYRRSLPQLEQASRDRVESLWSQGGVQYVTAGSVEGLVNLDRLLTEGGRRMLRRTLLVTSSGRVVKKATIMAVRPAPVLAEGPEDGDLVNALVADRCSRHPKS